MFPARPLLGRFPTGRRSARGRSWRAVRASMTPSSTACWWCGRAVTAACITAWPGRWSAGRTRPWSSWTSRLLVGSELSVGPNTLMSSTRRRHPDLGDSHRVVKSDVIAVIHGQRGAATTEKAGILGLSPRSKSVGVLLRHGGAAGGTKGSVLRKVVAGSLHPASNCVPPPRRRFGHRACQSGPRSLTSGISARRPHSPARTGRSRARPASELPAGFATTTTRGSRRGRCRCHSRRRRRRGAPRVRA
jgi:hypothetical protein